MKRSVRARRVLEIVPQMQLPRGVSYLLITLSRTVNDAANEFHAGEKKVRCYNLPFLSPFRLFIAAA